MEKYIWVLLSIAANTGAGITLKHASTGVDNILLHPFIVVRSLILPVMFYCIAFIGYAKALQFNSASMAYIMITSTTFISLLLYDAAFNGQALVARVVLGSLFIIAGLGLLVR